MGEVTRLTLFDEAPALPEGFAWAVEALGKGDEHRLMAWFDTLSFTPYRHRGYDALRQVAWFGERYDPETRVWQPPSPMPAELEPARALAADFAGVAPADLANALINRYPPGAPIGWHKDRPQFGIVVGISLGGPCTLRLRRRQADGRFERINLPLPPRSIYRLAGPARREWEHSIPPHTAPRTSITFRTMTPPG